MLIELYLNVGGILSVFRGNFVAFNVIRRSIGVPFRGIR